MPKISRIKLGPHARKRIIEKFFVVLDKLTPGERKFFLERFLTPTELEMLSKRLAVLKEVADEKKSYGEIKERFKVNQATIANLRNSLRRFGEGYKYLIIRLREF